MSDSNPGFSPAADEPGRKRPTRRDKVDDESIDLGQSAPVDEGSAVLSYSSARSTGPTSGSSIVSWDELARAHATPGSDDVELGTPGAVDFDAASDMDLLRKVLSHEPPPSQIIHKDLLNAAKADASADDEDYDAGESALEGFDDANDRASASKISSRRLPRVAPSRPPTMENAFALPPELGPDPKSFVPVSGHLPPASQADDDDDTFHILPGEEGPEHSSILGSPSAGPGHSGISSDLWADSSRVDLLGNMKPLDLSSGSLQHTDEVDAPPVVPSRDDNDDMTDFDSSLEDEFESSAVDLGTQAAADLPFPLGLDSSAGSASGGKKERSKPSGNGRDSGTVDLLEGSNEFNLVGVTGMSSVVRQLQTDKGDLPPTTPMEPLPRGRARAWAGGTLIGLAGGAVAAVGIWFAGYVPPSESFANTPIPRAAPTDEGKALAAADVQIRRLQVDLAAQREAAAKAKTAATDAGKARTELNRIKGQLTAARLTAADLAGVPQRLQAADAAVARANTANQELEKLREQLKTANLDPANLEGAAKLVAQAKTAADDVRKARAEVASIHARIRAAELDPADLDGSVKALKEARVKAEASLKEVEEKLKAQTLDLPASQTELSDLVKLIAVRLQSAKLVGPNPKPAEILAALDKSVASKPAPRGTPLPPTDVAVPSDKAGADQALATGLQALKDRNFAAAINPLTTATRANPRDARAFYLLAIARMQLGQSASAYQLLEQGRGVAAMGATDPEELNAALRQLTPTEQLIVKRFWQ